MAYKLPNGSKMDKSPIEVKGNPYRAKNFKQAVNPFDAQSKEKRKYNKKNRNPLAPAATFLGIAGPLVKGFQEGVLRNVFGK
jgi:hypothetical protein